MVGDANQIPREIEIYAEILIYDEIYGILLSLSRTLALSHMKMFVGVESTKAGGEKDRQTEQTDT